MVSGTPAASDGDDGVLSIVIKCLNEETKIARAIESALDRADELRPLALEVVVADSASDDRTVEIAQRYPVRLVRMRSRADRGCGAGAQMGYAWSRGAWVYLMDGDMCLQPGFLPRALAMLRSDPGLAGVGGAVVDERICNGIDRIRVNNRSVTRGGPAPWLAGGGLYRRSAIEQGARYAADRNLRGYEEADLGLRLRAAGWRLNRLDQTAVTHVGHDLDTWALLRRHWHSRRAMSAGVMLRAAAGHAWWWGAVRLHRHPLLTAVWWLLLLVGVSLGSAVAVLGLWVAASLMGLAALALVKRDGRQAITSVLSWHYALGALALGWFEPRVDPRQPLPAELVHDAVPSQTPAQ